MAHCVAPTCFFVLLFKSVKTLRYTNLFKFNNPLLVELTTEKHILLRFFIKKFKFKQHIVLFNI